VSTQTKLGIITFFAEDRSHGYLSEIESMDTVKVREAFYNKDKSKSYRFTPEYSTIRYTRGQIVAFNGKVNKNSTKLARIVRTEISGYCTLENNTHVVNLLSISDSIYQTKVITPTGFKLEGNSKFIKGTLLFEVGRRLPGYEFEDITEEERNEFSFYDCFFGSFISFLFYPIQIKFKSCLAYLIRKFIFISKDIFGQFIKHLQPAFCSFEISNT
jgi:hypothetical protein